MLKAGDLREPHGSQLCAGTQLPSLPTVGKAMCLVLMTVFDHVWCFECQFLLGYNEAVNTYPAYCGKNLMK